MKQTFNANLLVCRTSYTQFLCFVTVVVFPPDGGLYNKDRLGLITVMLACEAMRMHKQIKTRCRVYTHI